MPSSIWKVSALQIAKWKSSSTFITVSLVSDNRGTVLQFSSAIFPAMMRLPKIFGLKIHLFSTLSEISYWEIRYKYMKTYIKPVMSHELRFPTSKSSATRLFPQWLAPANEKGHNKALHYWSYAKRMHRSLKYLSSDITQFMQFGLFIINHVIYYTFIFTPERATDRLPSKLAQITQCEILV